MGSSGLILYPISTILLAAGHLLMEHRLELINEEFND
jgi:hypothetical protein